MGAACDAMFEDLTPRPGGRTTGDRTRTCTAVSCDHRFITPKAVYEMLATIEATQKWHGNRLNEIDEKVTAVADT